MNNGINPQLPYYLMLYLLTIVLRCIRAYRNRPVGTLASEAQRGYLASYFFFGFELVNVAAGVFILLSEHASKYVGTVMILYVILVIFSFFIEENNVGLRVRTAGHVTVSLVIVGVTLASFMKIDGLRGPVGDGSSARWRVALPFVDATLNRNFAVRLSPVQSVWVTDVTANGRSAAIDSAKARFYSVTGPKPFLDRTEKSPVSMIVLDASVVAERRAEGQ